MSAPVFVLNIQICVCLSLHEYARYLDMTGVVFEIYVTYTDTPRAVFEIYVTHFDTPSTACETHFQ